MFEQRIAEDIIQYSIYKPNKSLNQNSNEKTLEHYLKECLVFVFQKTGNHIWQNESFNLHVVNNCSVPHLSGSTNFGDSIDDEWLIVYLLQKITEAFPELIAYVQDTDGQFLLIEAAEHIPKWLTPDTSENRVFLSCGEMHILLKPTTPGNIVYCPVAGPTLEQALQIIAAYPSQTIASLKCLDCINKRTERFSQNFSENTHFTNVFIPKELVYILDQYPNFISKCVKNFYLRDPIDLRNCRTFKYVFPNNRVWTQVPITRCHYAQLMQQNFSPDKRSGYQIPTCSLTATEEKGWDLGLKISHGCEIFCSKKINASNTSDISKIYKGQSFLDFIKALTGFGYFGDEIEGSKLYQELYIKAKQYYLKALDNCNCDEYQPSTFLSSEVLKLLQSLKDSNSFPDLIKLKIKSSIKELPPESPDNWMNLNEEDIKKIGDKFKEGFSSLQKSKNKCKISESTKSDTQQQMAEAVTKVSKFVNKVSDFSGIEVDDQSSVTFDTKQFVASLEKILNVSYSEKITSFSSGDESEDFLSDSSWDTTDDKDLSEYMQCLDHELADTAISQSFVKANTLIDVDSNEKTSDHLNCKSEVDIETNLLQNFMAGRSEEINSGPISNILSSVNADLPSNS